MDEFWKSSRNKKRQILWNIGDNSKTISGSIAKKWTQRYSNRCFQNLSQFSTQRVIKGLYSKKEAIVFLKKYWNKLVAYVQEVVNKTDELWKTVIFYDESKCNTLVPMAWNWGREKFLILSQQLNTMISWCGVLWYLKGQDYCI